MYIDEPAAAVSDVLPEEDRPSAHRVRVNGRRVLVVTPQPFYEDRGTPIAVGLAARALSELGYELDVLSFPFGRAPQLPRVRTIRCSNPLQLRAVPIGFSWKKCLLDVSLVQSFEALLKRKKYHVIHAVEEAAYLASLFAGRVPFIYDMASSIPEELARKPVLGSKAVQEILTGIERSVLNRAAHVICSAGLGSYVARQTRDTPVTEWQFPGSLPPADAGRTEDLARNLDIGPKSKVVVYCGNFAEYQGMDLLFDAFASLAATSRDCILLCVGATEREREAWLSRLGPSLSSQVRIVTRQRREHVSSFLALADCLVSLRPVNRNVPLKIFEYMSSGRPIVATRGSAHEAVLSSERALLCDATAQGVSTAIRYALRFPERASRLGNAARAYANRHFNWSAFVALLDRVYGNVLRPDLRPLPALSALRDMH